MSEQPAPAPIPFAAIIVAAGKGLRAGQPLPKQFAPWRGKSVLGIAAQNLADAGASPICVAIPEGADEVAAKALAGIDGVILVTGGETRQASVHLALEVLEAAQPEYVLIHDAARPDCPPQVVSRLIAALETYQGAIPTLPIVDSLIEADGDRMKDKADRDILRRVQTPQAFRFPAILAAHRAWTGPKNAGDDAQVAQAAGHTIALVDGDERLAKLTFADDFKTDDPMDKMPSIRTGSGYDVHRFGDDDALWLCGIKIDHPRGLAGHSDADVALHAVVDAVLGAVGQGDIGQHFPPSDPQWKGASSSQFVEHAVKLADEAGYRVGNVDLTIICEAPKIGPHRAAMTQILSALLGVDQTQVNIKATTTERLGFTGRGEGIAAQAVATMMLKPNGMSKPNGMLKD